jgi:sorting nexin-17
LYESLKREFGYDAVGEFPPKQFFYVSPKDCEERRYELQRFLQKIAQRPAIIQGSTFQTFLLNAQKEVQKGPEEEVQLDILLPNGKCLKVDIMSTDQSDDVLETVSFLMKCINFFQVCGMLDIPADLTYYFGLFLLEEPNGTVIRKLQEFESPFISLGRAHTTPESTICIQVSCLLIILLIIILHLIFHLILPALFLKATIDNTLLITDCSRVLGHRPGSNSY